LVTEPQRREVLLAVFLVSGGALAQEVLLARLLALRFWPHFVPLVVSQAMLGFGAAGVALHLGRVRLSAASAAAMYWITLAAAASFELAFRASQAIRLDPFLLLFDLRVWPVFALFFAVLAVPFLLSAVASGIPLAFPRGPPGPVYAASFLGSAGGALASALVLPLVRAEWLLRVPSALALAAALVLVRGVAHGLRRLRLAALLAVGLLLAAPAPDLLLSPYKDLATLSRLPEARVLARRQGLHGDVRAVTAPGIHLAPGLSLAFDGEIPPQAVVLVDGEAAGVVPAASEHPPDYLGFLPSALPYRLLDRPSVLQLGLRGTEGMLSAAVGGAVEVTVVEPSRELVELVTRDLAAWSGPGPTSLRVEVRLDEPRAYFARAQRRFDLVELTDVSSATFASLGVHAAGENYVLTREGLGAALDRAGDRGLVAFSGWLKSPPRESVKLLRTLRAVLEARGLSAAERVMVVRGWGTFAVVVGWAPFGAEERARAERFCREMGFALVWPLQPANDPDALEVAVSAADALIGRGTRGDRILDLSPATDDSPYFHRFLRPSALGAFRRALGRAWIPFVEWGVVFQLLELPVSLAVAAAALAWPALRGRRSAAWPGSLAYFAALGLGYMLLELVFLKVGMLALGSTAAAATATIGGFTCFSGLGSALSGRVRSPGGLARACVASGIVGLAGLLLLEAAAPRLLALGPALRLALFLASLGPAAALMGVPFPAGLVQVGRTSPASVAPALAVNGFWSVAGAALAPAGTLWLGFRLTATAGAVLYLAAAALGHRLSARGMESSWTAGA
jgi:hypothetical protein